LGQDLGPILVEFSNLIQQSSCIVAHNLAFDEKIIGAELLRAGLVDNTQSKNKICTMLATVNYCQIPGKYGFKWPKLSELYTKLFNNEFSNAHNAMADITATAACFWELKKIGLIK
jgi:DNA polymerase III epsilon subunit-like protein